MIVVLAGIFSAAAGAFTQGHPTTFREISADPAAAAAFKAMTKGHRLPDWIHGETMESLGHEIVFGGEKIYVMNACKQHDCGAEQIAVMYDPGKKIVYGVLLLADPETRSERLTWMNLGAGNESIDGRTILYAALTTSLENHPEAFDYN